MRILLTGGRAPAALELVRGFGRDGCGVYAADSIGQYLSMYSRYTKSAYTVNSPRFCEDAFIDDLIHIINENKIDILFPTCEEIFWISKNKDRLSESCGAKIICDSIGKLSLLHNKYRFIELAGSENICVPETRIFRGERIERKSVIKPVFSRFGEDAVIVENQSDADGIDFGGRQCIIQDFIDGEPVCSYGYAENGVLKFNICYKSPRRAKTFTAFVPFECAEIDSVVRTVAGKLSFTGNISFDFIRRGNEYFVIECNPRITSGIHTLRNNSFDTLFFGAPDAIVRNSAQILLPNIASLTKGFGLTSCRDVIWDKGDIKPFFRQLECVSAFWRISKRQGISLTKSMTYDIEWNGEESPILQSAKRG